MRYLTRLLAAAGVAGLLSACGSFDGVTDGDGGLQTASVPVGSQPAGAVSDFPVKIGAPYQVAGRTYTPAEVADYDEVGYASFYGQELAGRPTANGEIFNPAGISAAHKTLPLPTYVEVTSLDTGRTILVRVNDRGPFAHDRLIDLSAGAAQQLGIMQQGVAGVRVRKVNPTESERVALRSGNQATLRVDTPDSLLVVLRDKLAKLPRPAASAQRGAPVSVAGANPSSTPGQRDGRFIREGTGTPAPATRTAPQPRPDGRFVREGVGGPQPASLPRQGGYVVQLASFSSRSRADALARRLGANVEPSVDGSLFRVRYGPYASEAEAQSGLATARERGYPNAKIFRR